MKANKMVMIRNIIQGDNLEVIKHFADYSVDLIYIDPPWNTGKIQKKITKKFDQDDDGPVKGFGGKRYNVEVVNEVSYDDRFENYLGFLKPRLVEAYRLLEHNGSFFIHINQNEEAYVKIMLDKIFGRDNFMRQIIHSWDYGGKTKKNWSLKHSAILWYAKDRNNYTFNYNEIDRVCYKAPKLVSHHKRVEGKVPTAVWDLGIVGTNSKEKEEYPSQKPLKLLERIIKVHSNPFGLVMDFFAGTGTCAEAAVKNGRQFYMIDNNPVAIETMKKRLAFCEPKIVKIT